jgi:acetylornithine/N-succinyldiaminopimelate aminotransferase
MGVDAEYRSMVTMNEANATTPELIDLAKRYWLPVYHPSEVILDHGKGARVWDRDGRDYIDFGAGIAVNGLGHGDADLIAALTAQAHKLWHTSNVF